jgi:sodium/hydrogen exchanger-like protein 6/7/sodium/hydrogen exchanger 8
MYELFNNPKINLNGHLFFLIILPPIIFSGGYNLLKRRFFQNFFYICLYGVFGTIISFFVVYGFSFLLNENGI